MHCLFQRGKVRSQTINVPEGLPELLSDITREVLRCQPTSECLCQFIINYLQSVINARNKALISKSIINRALQIVDDVIADLCICNISREKSDYMSTAMEECFKNFLEQRRCEKGKRKEIVKFKDNDMMDELMKKCKFTDDELKISKPVIETAYKKFVDAYLTSKDTTDAPDCMYQYFQKREADRMEQRLRQQAAVKIQSNFRGYLVRKSLFMEEPIKPPSPDTVSETAVDQEELHLAALKIQRFYRRHKSERGENQSGDKMSSQDGCSKASNISLTAHPLNRLETLEGSQNLYQNEQQPELLAENLEHQEDLENNINEAEKEAAENDLINQDMTEDFPNE